MCSVLLQAIVTVVFSSATFIDIQGLLDLTSIITQIKISLALVALLRLKWKYGHLERTVKVGRKFAVRFFYDIRCFAGILFRVHVCFSDSIRRCYFVPGSAVWYPGHCDHPRTHEERNGLCLVSCGDPNLLGRKLVQIEAWCGCCNG